MELELGSGWGLAVGCSGVSCGLILGLRLENSLKNYITISQIQCELGQTVRYSGLYAESQWSEPGFARLSPLVHFTF